MEKSKGNIQSLSFNFAVEVIKYCEELEKIKRLTIAFQLLKSGTSVGANISEAQHSETKPDFIHKMKIAEKEASETEFWLKICQEVEGYPETGTLLDSLLSIQKLLSRIITTCKRNIKASK